MLMDTSIHTLCGNMPSHKPDPSRREGRPSINSIAATTPFLYEQRDASGVRDAPTTSNNVQASTNASYAVAGGTLNTPATLPTCCAAPEKFVEWRKNTDTSTPNA